MNSKRRIGFAGTALSIALAISLVFGVLPAWATVEDDQTSLTDEEVAAAIERGEVNLYDEQNNQSDIATLSATSVSAVQGNAMKAFSGIDRYDTAAMQATYGWSSSRYAIVAGGNSWPDALAASSLAGALDCPVLLTPSTQLVESTADALTLLGVQEVLVIGGEPSVAPEVVGSIQNLGATVTRLSGDTRFDTQIAIYKYGLDRDLWNGELFAVTSGTMYSDALSFSPVATARKAPVFLTDDTGSLSANQEAVLIEGAKQKGLFKKAILLGGVERVSGQTAGFLSGVSYLATGQTTFNDPQRLSGSDRYDTSRIIADWAVSSGYLGWNGVAFSTAASPNDALGGGALQGKEGSVLLLISEDDSDTAIDAVSGKGVSTLKLFGSKTSIPNTVRLDMADRLGFAYSDIAGLKVYIDAGHGWDSSNNGVMDWGASGCGYTEWELTSDLANRVGDELRNTYGIDTYVNDKGGWYKLRQAEAQALDCDLLISIHFNAFNGSANGVESYIHNYNAHYRSETLQAKVHPALVSSIGLYNRGMKDAELAVCGGKLPAVLLEICFIDNQNDMNTFNSKRDVVARGIAAGIAS